MLIFSMTCTVPEGKNYLFLVASLQVCGKKQMMPMADLTLMNDSIYLLSSLLTTTFLDLLSKYLFPCFQFIDSI